MFAYTFRHRIRLVQYSLFGIPAFLVDLGLLYILRDLLSVPYYFAVPVAFLLATTLHYLALRFIVFTDTERHATTGYFYFLIIMTGGALAVTLLVAGLVEFFEVQLYVARVAVGTLSGFVSFFLNSRYNFRVL
jgi:putative flippase GtrA